MTDQEDDDGCCCNSKFFGLDDAYPIDFVTSQWQAKYPPKTSLGYYSYRVVITLYVTISYIGYIITLPYDRKYFPIYLTHWGLTFILAFEICDFFLLTRSLVKGNKVSIPNAEPDNEWSWLRKMTWVLSTVASSGALFITPFYFLFLYDPDFSQLDYWNLFVHGINSVLMVLEVWVTARPWRWQHFYMPLSVGMLYTVFSLIYFELGGVNRFGQPYIYPFLDWNDPSLALTWSFMAIVLTIATHFINCLMCELRKFIDRNCCGGSRDYSQLEKGNIHCNYTERDRKVCTCKSDRKIGQVISPLSVHDT